MKKLIIILLLTIPSYSQTGWFWQNPIPQANSLCNIEFVNEKNWVGSWGMWFNFKDN